MAKKKNRKVKNACKVTSTLDHLEITTRYLKILILLSSILFCLIIVLYSAEKLLHEGDGFAHMRTRHFYLSFIFSAIQ